MFEIHSTSPRIRIDYRTSKKHIIMKKKLKNLALKKNVISKLQLSVMDGGGTIYPTNNAAACLPTGNQANTCGPCPTKNTNDNCSSACGTTIVV